MSRLIVSLLMCSTLVLLTSCSDLAMNEVGSGGMAGVGGSGGREPIVDPAPKTRDIGLGCTQNITSLVQSPAWELEVDPGPIVAGETFGAVFRGRATFGEAFLHNAELWVEGGFDRVGLEQIKATVVVRSGATATGPPLVLVRPGQVQKTCTYDESGSAHVGAGPFPVCSEEDDNEDGSNEGCVGLGGAPSSENRCLEHLTIETSDDCDPGGVCDTLDGGLGLKNAECEENGFCVTASLEVRLQAEVGARGVPDDSRSFRAGSSGSVFFGWDDQNTGATVQEGGHDDGVLTLRAAIYDEEPGPNSIRARIPGFAVAYECTMSVGTRASDGVDSETRGRSRTPDYKLIHFPIQRR